MARCMRSDDGKGMGCIKETRHTGRCKMGMVPLREGPPRPIPPADEDADGCEPPERGLHRRDPGPAEVKIKPNDPLAAVTEFATIMGLRRAGELPEGLLYVSPVNGHAAVVTPAGFIRSAEVRVAPVA